MRGRASFLALCCFVLLAFCCRQGEGDDLTLLFTRDTFCQILPVNMFGLPCSPGADATCNGGIARRGTHVENTRDDHPDSTLLVDFGGSLAGSLFQIQFGSEVLDTFYPYMGYDAYCLNVQDFTAGVDLVSDFFNTTGIPAISANMDASTEPRMVDFVERYKIFDLDNGHQVGLTCDIDEAFRRSVRDPGNLTVSDSEAGLRRAVSEMLDQGVDKIVVGFTTRDATAIRDMIDRVYGIDVVVVGGTPSLAVHQTPWGARVLIMSVGTFGARIGTLVVDFDAGGLIPEDGYTQNNDPLTNDTAADPVLEAGVVSLYNTLQEQFSVVVGSSLAPLPYTEDEGTCRVGQCAIANFATEAMRMIGGTQIGFTNAGSVRAPLPEGDITLGDLHSAFPFDNINTLSTFGLLGRDLWSVLENAFSQNDPMAEPVRKRGQWSGLRVAWNPNEPAYSRIVRISVEVSPGVFKKVNNDTVYTIAVNSFLRSGGDGYDAFRDHAIDPNDVGASVLSAYLEYLTDHSPIEFLADNRLTTTSEKKPDPFAPTPLDKFYMDWDDPSAVVMTVICFILSIIVLCTAVFVCVFFMRKPVSGNGWVFHSIVLPSLFLACYIIYFFVGDPTDGVCAVRAWSSLVFTFLFGAILAKQIAVCLLDIKARRQKEEGIIHVGHHPWIYLATIGSLLAAHLIFLIIWTAVDPPERVIADASANHNSQITCRSDHDEPWLVILFAFYGAIMLAGIGLSIWLYHISVMWRQAQYAGFAAYLITTTTVCAAAAYNALRDIQLAAFWVLGVAILVTVLGVLLILYLPIVYVVVFESTFTRKGKSQVQINFDPSKEQTAAQEDNLDYL